MTLAVQLAKLIPRLASDHDGEIVATVKAIGRTLKSAGSDFHALAAAVERGPFITQHRDNEHVSKPPPMRRQCGVSRMIAADSRIASVNSWTA